MEDRPRAAYIKRQLSIDPRSSASRIIAARNAELGLTIPEKHRPVPIQSPDAVASAQSRIALVRENFWAWPLERIEEQLNAIDSQPYPELAALVLRLKQAALARPEFPKLAARLGANLGLFQCFKQSMTQPPRDVAGMKESVMRSLLRGENLRAYKQAATIIRTEFPRLYALEHEWFDNIQSVRAASGSYQRYVPSIVGVPIWLWVVLIITAMRGCVSLLK